jgi:hypothetical protein
LSQTLKNEQFLMAKTKLTKVGIFISTLLVAIGLIQCTPTVVKYSSRNPDLFQKPTDKLVGQSRGNDENSAKPEIYVKQKKISIESRDKPNTTGSLFNPESEGNYLFTPASPMKIGRYLTVNIVSARNKAQDPDTKPPAAAKPGDPAAPEDDLLKALPDLTPKEKGEVSLLKDFKMKITHKYPNGDVLAQVERNSQTVDDFHNLSAEARIPYEKLASGDPLTTDDLTDVKFNEYQEDEAIHRHSSGWQDEYSLRLSGFNEAKSKVAAELADQRSKMQETKQRLEERIKTLSTERKLIAKQREELSQKRQDSENKLKNAKEKIQESTEVIEEQKQTIEEQQQALEAAAEAEKEKASSKKGSKDE